MVHSLDILSIMAFHPCFFLFVFLSCVAQWKSYQEARQTVIELMNEAEKKLTEFSTAKAATSQEAEDKLCSHRV